METKSKVNKGSLARHGGQWQIGCHYRFRDEREGVRRLLVAMTLVDTKYRCFQKEPLMVVPFVVDESAIEAKRRERKRERGLQQKRHEYGGFRLIVIVVVVIGLSLKNAR